MHCILLINRLSSEAYISFTLVNYRTLYSELYKVVSSIALLLSMTIYNLNFGYKTELMGDE